MRRQVGIILSAGCLFAAAGLAAAEPKAAPAKPKAAAAAAAKNTNLPSMHDQKAWTEADKAKFLQFLNTTGGSMPGGDVAAGTPGTEGFGYVSHAARSLEFSPTFLNLYPMSSQRYSGTVHGTVGAKMLVERHVTPWLRWYAGLEYDGLHQRKRDGETSRLSRWAVPAGVEFALVPLATPQTRYVLIRLGLVACDVVGAGKRGDYEAPLLGATVAYNLGLGYEWQIADTPWRVNATFDGLRSIANRAGVAYYGLGLTAGVAYTF